MRECLRPSCVAACWGGITGVRMFCTPQPVSEQIVCQAVVEALEDLASELAMEIPRHDPILSRDFSDEGDAS